MVRNARQSMLVAAVCAWTWAAPHACAQLVLVQTTTMTAAREAARVYTQAVELTIPAPPTLPQLLPGEALAGSCLITSDGDTLITSTFTAGGASRAAQSFLSISRTIPLALQPQDSLILGNSGLMQLHALVEDPATGAKTLVTFGSSGSHGERGPWQLRARAILSEPVLAFAPQDAGWLLPGEPVACAALPGRPVVAVLCRAPDGGGVLHVRDVTRGEIVVEALMLPGAARAQEPVGLAASQDGRQLYALSSGYSSNGGAARTSTLQVISGHLFDVASNEVELPGDASGENAPLHPAEAGSCWVTTRSRSEGFAYAVLIQTSEASAKKAAEYSFGDAGQGLLLAVAEDGSSVAIAANNRLGIWPNGSPGGKSLSFDSKILALEWMYGQVLAGEAGRLHIVDRATGGISRTDQFQTGFVTAITPVYKLGAVPGDRDRDGLGPADEVGLGTAVGVADTDMDGLTDGIDMEPMVPSPHLVAPPIIDFRGEGIGRELRAIRLESPHGDASAWGLSFDSALTPWLRVYPRSGKLPGWFLVGIDPARYRSSDASWASIAVSLSGTHPGASASGSPRTIAVRVLPPGRSPRCILWLLDERAPQSTLRVDSDAWQLKGLADLLAQQPYRFSHRVETRPVSELPRDVSIVVLTAAAASRGLATRQALLDFVAEGGSLLFLGNHLSEEGPRPLARWLNPIGVELDNETVLNGAFEAKGSNSPVRYWERFRLNGGMRMRVADARAIMVPDPAGEGLAAFAAGAYGNGRIALLAAATPIESSALQTMSNRRFAGDLFTWLAEAGLGFDDLDADGLPDDVEDKNSNGVVDPGETDRLNPDSDGDGIPDSKEDRTRNGIVDPGETSPLNPDSDGDGIFDGADPGPLPNVDAPHIDFLEPSSAPAEGGTRVLLNGRNFSPSSRVFFGDRAAPRVNFEDVDALLVETPPSVDEKEGTVDVRVENTIDGQSGVLLGGFAYTPRSLVELSIKNVSASASQYLGVVSLHVDAKPESAVGLVIAKVRMTKEGRAHWVDAQPADSTSPVQNRITQRISEPSTIELVLIPRDREPIRGDVAHLTWRSDIPLADLGVLKFRIDEAKVYAISGQPMDVGVGALNVGLHDLPQAP